MNLGINLLKILFHSTPLSFLINKMKGLGFKYFRNKKVIKYNLYYKF